MYSDFFNSSRRFVKPNCILSSNIAKDLKINVSPIKLDSIEPVLKPLVKRHETTKFKKIQLTDEPERQITNFNPIGKESKSTTKGQDSVVVVDPNCVDTVVDFESGDEETMSYQKKAIPKSRTALKFLNNDREIQYSTFVNLKQFLDLQKTHEELESQKISREYMCKYCGENFSTGCALGGHISKIHRGMSKGYKKKIYKSKYKFTERERARYLRKCIQKDINN